VDTEENRTPNLLLAKQLLSRIELLTHARMTGIPNPEFYAFFLSQISPKAGRLYDL
jgi:hypothetical protein